MEGSKDYFENSTRNMSLQRELQCNPSTIFHDECSDYLSIPLHGDSMCSFCAHLRPWNLFFHALPKRAATSSYYCYSIPMGNLAEIRARAPDCGFCDFLTRCPLFSSLLAWTKISIGYYQSRGNHQTRIMISVDGEYGGDLLVQPQTISTVHDNRKIQWELVKRWLTHSSSRQSRNGASLQMLFDNFRLIDVIRMCVVHVPEPTDYTTLSYVWGTSPKAHFEATKRTLPTLEQEGSLASGDVPATIQDAIIATKALGLRYLWVDRICIVQDDDASKLPQINRMDIIFASSHVTLVAVGQDAMSGLPGVRADRREVIQAVQWNGLTIEFPYWSRPPYSTDPPNSHWDPSMSAWSKRGWTYQEAVVSNRLLFFTQEGAFLKNRDQDRVLVEGGTHFPCEWGSEHTHPSYDDAVKEISSRRFTYSTDILLAFQGILNWIIEKEAYVDKDHRFGLPFAEFDYAIQWYTVNDGAGRNPDKQQIFPSWTWASIDVGGEIIPGISSCGSLATWAFCEQDENNQSRLLPVGTGSASLSKAWNSHNTYVNRAIMMIAWLEGCFALPPPLGFRLDAGRLFPTQREIYSRFPTYADFWLAARGTTWQEDMFSSDDRHIASLSPGRVMVHTQCSLLDLEYAPGAVGDFGPYFRIMCPHRREIGGIQLSFESRKILSCLYMETGGMRMEFLALSVAHMVPYWMWHRAPLIKYFYENGRSRGDAQPLVDVMLVYRHGLVARRLGIGLIGLGAWGEIDRYFRTVILE